MAVNLTKPEDFTSSSTSNAGSSDSIALLPPTCFESTVHQSRSHEQLNANLAVDVKASNDNSWKELTAARNEILQLQLSLQQERESKQLAQDARPAGDVSQTNQPQGLDDVIVRQATEIAELKQDLSTNKASYRSQIEELEGWLASQVQKVASLETALEIEKEKWQEEVKGLRVRVEEEQRACEEKCREVEARLEESLQTRAQMEERLSSRERELQTEKTTLEDERSELKSQLEEKMAEVVKLKAYIGKGPVDDLPTNEELQEQTEKISRLVSDNERLTTQVGLLEVRLGAITQILTIQEKEMADVAPDVVSPAPGNLLTRWREKVYQLLVQQTSAELVHKKDLHDAECKVREVTKSLTAADSRDQILKHTIERDRAELDMARSELVSARRQVSELDTRRLNDRRAIVTLKTFMESQREDYVGVCGKLLTATQTLATYERRLTFAATRVSALAATQPGGATAAAADVVSSLERSLQVRDPFSWRREELESEEVGAVGCAACGRLQEELRRVTTERDALVRLQGALRSEIATLKRHLEESDRQQGALREARAAARRNVKEASVGEETGKRMAELEQKLQAERNEHVKAVAELIQLEEQIVTERDSSSASVKRLECQLGQELDRLRTQLAAIVTERNALLTNARQEGMQLEPQSNVSQPTEPCSPAESDKT